MFAFMKTVMKNTLGNLAWEVKIFDSRIPTRTQIEQEQLEPPKIKNYTVQSKTTISKIFNKNLNKIIDTLLMIFQ